MVPDHSQDISRVSNISSKRATNCGMPPDDELIDLAVRECAELGLIHPRISLTLW